MGFWALVTSQQSDDIRAVMQPFPESVMAGMQNEGEIAACNYHAGMTPKQRIQVQNQWRSGVLQVVVATIAFGMGEP